MKNGCSENILIYRIGSLGDILVSVPALHVVRRSFPQAHITLLSNAVTGQKRVRPCDVLAGAGLVDEFLSYSAGQQGVKKFSALFSFIRLIVELRKRGFSRLVYLAPSRRSAKQIDRDVGFFNLCGIKDIIGDDVKGQLNATHEADLLLQRLGRSGIEIPPEQQGNVYVATGEDEEKTVNQWLAGLPYDGGRDWVAIGVGSKMAVKRWPIVRYRKVVDALIEKYDIWPVLFGGTEDVEPGNELLLHWKRGYQAAGSLGVRSALAAMKRCVMYLGNDTGTMHMAAAAGLKCVAIFSGRDVPGRWDPYGDGHIVLRRRLDCENCMKTQCTDKNMQCIMGIGVDEVIDSCEKVLAAAGQLV